MTALRTSRRAFDHGQAGFGLIEVMAAVVVTTVGVFAAASGFLAIYSESTRSSVDTDRALAARSALERSARTPFTTLQGGQTTVSFGARRYLVAETVVALGSRLKSVRVDVTTPGSSTPVTFESRVVATRPLPVAP